MSVVLAAALIAFAVLGQVPRKTRVPGVLLPKLGLLQVSSPSAGTVLERRVAEGDVVEQGQVLFVVGVDRAGAGGETAALVAQTLTQRRQSLQAEATLREDQVKLRRHALTDRLRGLDREIAQATNEHQLAQQRTDLGSRTLERYKQLAASGFVSELQAQAKHEEWLDLSGRARASQRTVDALGRERAGVQAELVALSGQLQAELAQLDRSISAIDQDAAEIQARRTVHVTAPQKATITALHAHVGSTLQPGQAAATLVPVGSADGRDGELEAQLFAPSRAVGFVKPGQQVWLRIAAFPYQKFGMSEGIVSSVSHTPVNPQDLPHGQGQALLSAAQSSEPLFRITIRPLRQTISTVESEIALSPGMTLDAEVILERRTILELLTLWGQIHSG